MKSRKLSERYRPNATDRGYDAAWRRFSRPFLAARPSCLGCQAIGVTRQATVVDHIVPHRGDPKLLWDPRNWQPLCEWHHNSIKAELERRFHLKQITAAELAIASTTAVELTRAKHQTAIGADGYPIAGT